MGRLPTMHRKYNLRALHEGHKEVCRLILAGVRPSDVARQLGISSVTVTNVKNSELGREHLARLGDERDAQAVDIKKTIKEIIVPQALKVYRELLQNGGEGVRGRLVIDALNREGTTSGTGSQNIKGTVFHAFFTEEEKQELLRRQAEARAIGAGNGNLIEASKGDIDGTDTAVVQRDGSGDTGASPSDGDVH
jgi:hypothetical protein